MATMTTAEIATELDTTPRTLRKFLRFDDRGVGKGSRYAIERKDLRSLKARYAKWAAALEAKANDAATPPDDAPDGDDA